MVEAAKGSLLASSRGGTVDGKSRDAWRPCHGFLPELPQNRREEGELPSRGEDGRNAGLGKWPTIYGVVLVLGWHRTSISIRAGGVVDGNVDSHCLACSDGLFPSGSNLWGVWTTGDRSVKRVVIRSSPFSAVCSRVCLCSPGDQNNVRSQSLRADHASRQGEIRFPLHAREGGRDRGIHHSLQRRDEEVSCEVVTASSALNMHLPTKSQLLEFPSQQSAPLATPLAAPHRLILFYFYFFAQGCVLLCTAEIVSKLITTVGLRRLDDSDSDSDVSLKGASCRCRDVDDPFRKWTRPSWGIPTSASPSWRHPSEMPSVWLIIRLSVAQMNSHWQSAATVPSACPPGRSGDDGSCGTPAQQ